MQLCRASQCPFSDSSLQKAPHLAVENASAREKGPEMRNVLHFNQPGIIPFCFVGRFMSRIKNKLTGFWLNENSLGEMMSCCL